MAVSAGKLFAFLLLFITAAVAVQACTEECAGCNAYGAYWNGQGCGEDSNQVFSVTLKNGTDHKACCGACVKSACCLFWVYDPSKNTCKGYSNCNRIDGQPTVREWLGDWKVLDLTCEGYSEQPDAQIDFPAFRINNKSWPVGNNPQVYGD
ncbi:hypothetical protein KFL_000030455 [Klebsormidium nitens]|uniref:Apple domain-containing protein n=1 Tax=Klebsormidium nitens TaxID=105231 RepID=A0A1Y1HPL6_KLENI|nr:hypothetical protein KFL_000030455 [Klebsormidium nitens]|eukprot:GAQ77768.1 hypothetical protein KFL_000030455 [Klebsormidium nitens]